ncbi:DUF1330 domain-containing protein [Erythrobacter sp. THAF29]|uniref:DUF1330 domain-containing protein n=1 Tax=Erythrobacter sp. THAF29 TaxID=2587851 RepID=UPI0012678A0B|nr:DUF1330 domain-containing protein [Erythrobacter sp. THAF29]QFT77124.1 hypothetical protein FIU90_06185 [Erythrobacter sp. THAF29]
MRPVSIVQALLVLVLAVPAHADTGSASVDAAEATTKAYLVSEIAPSDMGSYRAYLQAVLPIIQSFGGRVLVSPFDPSQVIEGRELEGRLAVIEFPSATARDAFWNSPEYLAVKHLRLDNAKSRIIHVGK